MKKVRITFRSEVVVEGETLADCKSKFESMELFTKESGASFIEEVSVEDAETYKDIESEWENCDDVPEDENGTLYMCPRCGHTFRLGEWNYNYDTALLDFECPDCGWCGSETQCNTYED